MSPLDLCIDQECAVGEPWTVRRFALGQGLSLRAELDRGPIRMVRSRLIACGASLNEERDSCDTYAGHHRSRGDGNRTFDHACGESGHEPLQPAPYLVVGNGADDD